MSVTIVATPGASDANSYATYDEAVAYFETRLDVDAWTDASSGTRRAALVLSTSILDKSYSWVGLKVTKAQALRWPRYSVTDQDDFSVSYTTIPDFLIEATAEFALMLLADDRLKDPDTQGFSQMKVGSLYLQVSKGDRQRVIPTHVDLILSPYGVTHNTSMRTLERT